MNKFSEEEFHEYLKQWYASDDLTDFNMAWDSGFTDYCIYLIYSAGALRSDPPIEKEMIKRMRKYKPDADLDACFKNAVIYRSKESSALYFVSNDYIDYLVEPKDFHEELERV